MDGYKGYEQAPYAVERRDGAVELRRYAPHTVAEVTVEGSRATAASRGFRVLAGYIFGANESSAEVAMTVPVAQSPAPEKIAMTVPVAQARADGGLWTFRFMVPARYTLDTLPKPNDSRIRFLTLPGERQAVIGFSGLVTEAALARQEAALRDWIAKAGLKPSGAPVYYFYDDPFTLPWKRRNEVALRVG